MGVASTSILYVPSIVLCFALCCGNAVEGVVSY